MTHSAPMSALYPFTEHHLDLDGLRYHYVDEGNVGDGRSPMVMVHGNPSWSFYYRNLIKAFSNSHRCIAMDHIGCGRSDKPSDDRYEYTLRRRIDDLTRLIDHLGLERITLVVHDWGGMIGMGWATRFPQRVERILVLNTAAFHLPRGSSMPLSLKLARTPGLGGLLVRGLNVFSLAANRLCVNRRPMTPAVSRGYLAPYDSWRNRRETSLNFYIQVWHDGLWYKKDVKCSPPSSERANARNKRKSFSDDE